MLGNCRHVLFAGKSLSQINIKSQQKRSTEQKTVKNGAAR